MILVMGGIHEAKRIFDVLQDLGIESLLTVATQLGETQYAGSRLERYTVESLVRAAREHDFRMIINATHPHAAEASRTARSAAQELGIPLIRFERPNSELDLPSGARSYPDFRSALEACSKEIGDGRLLVTGVKHIADCLDFIPKEQLYIRLMPSSYSIAECEKHAIPLGNMIAIKTPVSLSMNLAIFKEFGITDFMFKASGEGSATASNLHALRAASSSDPAPSTVLSPVSSSDSSSALSSARTRGVGSAAGDDTHGAPGDVALGEGQNPHALRGWIVDPPATEQSETEHRFSDVASVIAFVRENLRRSV